MNPVIENLLTRRSVRAFQEKEIPEAQLEQILEAARYAPSAMARQTWKFTAVVNREKIQKLAAAMSAELGRSGYDMYSPGKYIPGRLVLRHRLCLDQPASGYL